MKKITLFLFIVLSFYSCKEDPTNNTDLDRTELLNNLGDNIIVPRYNKLKIESNSLNTAILDFTTNVNQNNLDELRTQFKQAYMAWQACSSFGFGPANTLTLKSILNTYPVDTLKISNNINSNTYNLAAAQNTDAIGFPALDYLLFGKNTNDIDLLNYFTNNTNALTYLEAVSTQINDAVNAVHTEWNSTYLTTFKNASGTDIGSSLGLLINDINLDFEKFIRDGKVGIPLGIRSLGAIQIEKSEAFYSDYSLELCKESVIQLQNLFNGVSTTGINGPGLEDYLDVLGATNGSEKLSDKINNQFDDIIEALNQLNNSIPSEIQNNQAQVEDVYNKMQQIIVLLKVDLSSNLGVLISYQDNDGD